jgi:hypothetical protein
VKEILESRGNAPRLFRNSLVPRPIRAEALGKYLAWDSIVEEKETLNLDPFQAQASGKSKASCCA